MPAAILLPASFVAFAAEGLLFAVADCLDAAGADSARHPGILFGARPLLAPLRVLVVEVDVLDGLAEQVFVADGRSRRRRRRRRLCNSQPRSGFLRATRTF